MGQKGLAPPQCEQRWAELRPPPQPWGRALRALTAGQQRQGRSLPPLGEVLLLTAQKLPGPQAGRAGGKHTQCGTRRTKRRSKGQTRAPRAESSSQEEGPMCSSCTGTVSACGRQSQTAPRSKEPLPGVGGTALPRGQETWSPRLNRIANLRPWSGNMRAFQTGHRPPARRDSLWVNVRDSGSFGNQHRPTVGWGSAWPGGRGSDRRL